MDYIVPYRPHGSRGTVKKNATRRRKEESRGLRGSLLEAGSGPPAYPAYGSSLVTNAVNPKAEAAPRQGAGSRQEKRVGRGALRGELGGAGAQTPPTP